MNCRAILLPIALFFCYSRLLAQIPGQAEGKPNPDIRFVFPDTLNNNYLKELREKYHLAGLVGNVVTCKVRALIILNWTHEQWQHNGNNEPSRPDALTILKEAGEGKMFRCVEYGIVVSTALQSIGIPARQLNLKTEDVETRPSGAGHVLAEVWLADMHKWALIDGQFNVMPVLHDTPLNAAEFGKAIAGDEPFELINVKGHLSKGDRKAYLRFVTQYLFYLDADLDQRHVPFLKQLRVNGKTELMYVPEGAKKPTVFQGRFPITNCLYTSCLPDFYKAPEIMPNQ